MLSGKFIHLKQDEKDKHSRSARRTPPATELLNFLFQRHSYCSERATTRLKQLSRLQCLRMSSTKGKKKINRNAIMIIGRALVLVAAGARPSRALLAGAAGVGGRRAPAGLKLSPRRGGENLFHFGRFPISQPLRGQEVQCRSHRGGQGREGRERNEAGGPASSF